MGGWCGGALGLRDLVGGRPPSREHLFLAHRPAGILAWLGIDLDTLPWLVGEPVVEVSASTRLGDPSLAVEDIASLILRFAGGALATLQHAYALPARAIAAAWPSAVSTAPWSFWLGETLTLVTGGRDGFVHEDTTTFQVPDVPGYGLGQAAVADLLAAIGERRETAANGELLVDALRLIEAAYRSARRAVGRAAGRRLAGSSAAVERVAQPVAHEVHGEDHQHDERGGRDPLPRVALQDRDHAGLLDEVAPRGVGGCTPRPR